MFQILGMTDSQREAYRMCKALRDKHGSLDSIKSFFMKNILVKMVMKNPQCLSGTRMENLLEFLKELKFYLKSKNLPHHRIEAQNLFLRISHDELRTLAYRISLLIDDRSEMQRVMMAE